jgi:pseudaminic acid synthase
MKYDNMIADFLINNHVISNKFPPYIIAEISANHNGSIDRAKQTILAAKKSGVDAVKIQTYTPDTMTIDVDNEDFLIKSGLWKDRTLYDLYGEAHTPFEWHEQLFEFASKNNITLFSSPFDETAVDLLDGLNVAAFKVASFEIVDLPLIKYIAQKGKPILISTGMASQDEIANAIETSYSAGNKDIALLHCISAYPTDIEDANLLSIQYLREKFAVQVGLSDHTLGNQASVIATSLGATIIEKHFTLDRNDGGVDSKFSLEPDEMSELVKKTKEAFKALGDGEFKSSSVEAANKIFRRSIYFVKNIEEGEIITPEHIKRIRPGYGLEPRYYDEVIGKKCIKRALKGDRLTFDHFNRFDKKE